MCAIVTVFCHPKHFGCLSAIARNVLDVAVLGCRRQPRLWETDEMFNFVQCSIWPDEMFNFGNLTCYVAVVSEREKCYYLFILGEVSVWTWLLSQNLNLLVP